MKLLSLMVCLCLSLVFNVGLAGAQTSTEIRGAWIHNYGPFDWETAMKELADAGFNTVFVRVARGANAIYPSQYLPGDDWVTEDEFQKALDAAHRHGLEFHAWKVCFFAGGAALQKGIAKTFYDELAAQDRLARDPEGKQAPFLNPADPRNQQLELDVLREMTEKYDVDGIHLDYIRYPENPHYDFDYSDVSRREFEKHIGQAVVNWPQDVFSGALKWRYENWERTRIDIVVQRAYQQTKQLKPRVQVSAAVWRANNTNRAAIKQDWTRWVKSGWLDFVVPMDYSKDDARFRSDLQEQIPHTTGHAFFAAGIGNYQHDAPEQTLRQIEIARAEGADGYVLFDYKPQVYAGLLAALKNQPRATALPFRVPKVEWKVGQGLERKDAPPAYGAGTVLGVRAKAAELQNLQAQLHSLDGQPALRLSEATVHANNEWGWRFALPTGRWRFLLSARDPQTGKDVTVRGPLFEGLPAGKIAELRANLQPPVVRGRGKRVAIYAGGLAESGLVRALPRTLGVRAYHIHQLKPDHLREAKVLLLPQLRDVSQFTPDAVLALRDWVAAGGVLLLTHDAVGFRWHARAFPEIGQGIALSKTRDVEVVENTFGLSLGKWQHEYPDHVIIEPGKNGSVLARNQEGQAVLVGGNFGKGKVFLYGALLGYAPGGSLAVGETQLLLELVGAHAEAQRGRGEQ